MFPESRLTMIRSFREFFPPHVVTLTTDRSADFRLPDKPPALSQAQKKFLARQLGFPLPEVFAMRQVHGDRVVLATKGPGPADKKTAWEEADGVLTSICDLPIAVRTADCLPIFIYDPRREAIGIIHAGWRGTQQRIAARAVQLLRRHWDCRPQDLRVAFGPAIRSCCYRVGAQFRQYFPAETTKRKEGYFLDLPQANKNQLVEAGVDAHNIFDSAVCTCCEATYFSYRREGQTAGRMISLMMLKQS